MTHWTASTSAQPYAPVPLRPKLVFGMRIRVQTPLTVLILACPSASNKLAASPAGIESDTAPLVMPVGALMYVNSVSALPARKPKPTSFSESCSPVSTASSETL